MHLQTSLGTVSKSAIMKKLLHRRLWSSSTRRFLFWERLRDSSTTNFRAQITSVLPDKYIVKTAILIAFLPNFLQDFTR